ncbi:uncharacterized protein LOC135369834 [Ornithodoros turicata]|uniref:uncharacterized protein LOC135369834 n=1 Tax=Ornithodoros turicata TaxID=34597 RepID=UPI003138C89D
MRDTGSGIIYTSVEAVGLGMDVLQNESCPFCYVWGWIIRAVYACYFSVRCAQYWYFLGHGYSSATIAHEVFLDVIFLTALAVNHLVNLRAANIRRLAKTVGRHDGPVSYFTTVLNLMTFLTWGAAVFTTVFAHTTTVNTRRVDSVSPPLREGLQISAIILSHYTHGILVFGSIVFSIILYVYLEYALCIMLQHYRDGVRNALTHNGRNSRIVHILLTDYYRLRNIVKDLEDSMRQPLRTLFVSGTLYVLDCVTLWTLSEGGVSVLLPSIVRAGTVVSLLFFTSDLGSRVIVSMKRIGNTVRTGGETEKETDREVLETCNSFCIEYFTDPVGVALGARWYLSRQLFTAWAAVTFLISAVAGIACHFAG